MFYVLNKLVGAVLSPVGISLLLVAIGLVFAGFRWRKTALGVVGSAFVWLLVWSLPGLTQVIGLSLEEAYPPQKVEEMPTADAIVLLGGGMGANPKRSPYAEMYSAADRVWHAARLFKAGKAPIIIPTGVGDKASTEPLLRDLGVPQEAIVGEYEARNTEENAKFVERLLRKRKAKVKGEGEGAAKVLLVTSGWHMRRAVLMYQKYAPGLEIIPASTDCEEIVADYPWKPWQYLPSGVALGRNTELFKELIGYWGYRILR